MPVCFQLVHDACRCTLEQEFKMASIPVVNAKTYAETAKAMQKTHPLATLCVWIDEGYKETLKHTKKAIQASLEMKKLG